MSRAAGPEAAAGAAGSPGLDPNACARLEDVQFRLAATYQSFGYRAVELPIQAPADLFERKSGLRVIPEIYVIPTDSDLRICLRPEFTPLLVRLLNERRGAIGLPARLHYAGPVFRRLGGAGAGAAHHYESGAELFGVPGPEADAEVLALAITALRAAGARDLTITVGHIDVITAFLRGLDLPAFVYELLVEGLAWDGGEPDPRALERRVLERIGAAPVGSGGVPAGVTRDELRAIGSAMLTSLDVRITGRRSQAEVVERMVGRLTAGQVRENVREAIRFIARLGAAAGPWPSALGAAEAALAAAGRDAAPLASLRRVLELLESESLEGSTVRVDLALGRGLQYYTGLVFEITAPGGRPVAGGGRYDDLVELLGGPDTPAVGFTVRVDPLTGAEPQAAPSPPLVAVELSEPAEDAFRVARALRQAGIASATVAPGAPSPGGWRIRARRDDLGRLQTAITDESAEPPESLGAVLASNLVPTLCRHIGRRESPSEL